MDEPRLIEGGLSVDDRGQVSFVNGFTFKDVKRFYLVSNHRQGWIRAFHGHKTSAEYALVINGAIKICAAKVEGNWKRPIQSVEVFQTVLSDKKPSVLFIPAGYANGFMTLTEDAQVMFFSTATLKEIAKDDYRFPFDYWDIWGVEQR